ncbi:MAG: dethiobiotin synthase [Holosporaceae bacterium]|jgi:dethiobiotin synthase|nr:dethiobiotin synthase [Holosporaceae bacterium]
MSIFVTGTDTNVGKTISSAWLCMHTGASYWKPIQTGKNSDKNVIKKISPRTTIIPEIYKFKAPLSPYDAANLENVSMDIGSLGERPEKTVIEGVGGAMVPLAKNFFLADFIKKYNVPALIVVKSKLGMINHTLMTVEILKRKKVDILGIVVNGKIENNLKSTIEKFSHVKILAVIPRSDNLFKTLEYISVPREISWTIK